MIRVDELAPRNGGPLLIRPQIYVDLRAGTARPRVPHHPEIILRAAEQDVVVRDSRFAIPQPGRLLVGSEPEPLIALVHRRIQPIRLEPPHIHQKLPRPSDGLLLEIVAEAPVAQHLEEGVMVGVQAYLLKVVVLSRDAKALLRIYGAHIRTLAGAQKDILELVHPGIREQQSRISARHEGIAGHHLVAPLSEEAQELLADLFGRSMFAHGAVTRIRRRLRITN